MTNIIIIGAQWGDEGKAKITDLLASRADVIMRYQGGCNAGHTVVNEKGTFKFHLIPSAVLYENKICLIQTGCVLHPKSFEKEVNELLSRNVDLDNLKISPLVSITMPYHIDLDNASEKNSSENKIGTTGKGIGPTYSDKVGRYGLKVQDLFSENIEERIDKILPLKNKILSQVYNLREYSKEEILQYCKESANILKPYVCWNLQEFLGDIKENKKQILFEGAQGVMLDIDWGTYPYVTSSNPISGGALTGCGFSPCDINKVIGVFKAYITRVGEGSFLTELKDKTGEKIQTIGHEFGTTTGRPRRCGWFDNVVARYSILTGGITNIALTKIDVFDDFEEIKICVAYKHKETGELFEHYPTDISLHKHLSPVYETHKGWMTKTSHIKEYSSLPENMKKYIKRIEELTKVKVSIISVGANRDQTIILDNFF